MIGKGEAHVAKIDAIVTDSHLHTRIKRRIVVYQICGYANARICSKRMGRECEYGELSGNNTEAAAQNVLG